MSRTSGSSGHSARRQSARCRRSRGNEHFLHVGVLMVWDHKTVMNATRTTLSDVLWRWPRAIGRALLLVGALAGMTLGAPAQAQIAFRAASQANSAAGQLAPTFVAAGAVAANAAAITPALPAGILVDDILLLFLETSNQAITIANQRGGTWTAVTNSPQITGTAATAAATRLTVFWSRYNGTQTAPVTTDSFDHQLGRIIAVRGVDTTGNPWNITAGGVEAVNTDTSGSIPGATTTVANTLVVAAIGTSLPDANGTAVFTNASWANASLTGVTERTDNSSASGNGGALGIATGVMATAGLYNATTVTTSVNTAKAMMSIALRPPDSVLTINVPAGTLANDVMIASITYRPCSNVSGAACTTTITPPAGWTQVNSVTDQTTGGGTGGFGNRLFVYQRVATGAEPANYTWTFGGQVVHAGAAGGILSFSGVDTTAPVVAEAGSLTASATSHTAPSVPLGAVTGAMLVTSHSANSSATWTAPAVMTSRVNAASLGVPNDLGLALQVNTLPNAPDPTVARAASWTSPPAADTGDTHTLALRPLSPPPPVAGGFNAYETSTAAGAITGVIKTKIAGSTISLDMIALNAAKTAIETTFTGTVRVEVMDSSNNTGALDSNNCRPTWTTIQTLSPDPAFIAGDNGRKTISFAVPDAYSDARLRITYPAGAPTTTGCSTDNFAIRPNAFTALSVSDTDWVTAGITRTLNDVTFGAITHKAGRPFSVRANAVNAAGTPAITANYTGAPAATLSACAGAACTATFGALSLNTTFVSGQLASNVATYDNVGSLRLQLVDSSFASVDSGDSTALEREIKSAVIDVGRFVPDHFAVLYNTPAFGTSCGAGGFTYAGQPFSYTTAPVITMQAQNFANAATTLYAGSWWRITSGSLTGKSYTAASGTLDTSGITGTDPVINDAGSGSGTLTFGSGTGLFFTRTTPVVPFDAELSLAVNVIDADGVVYASNPARFGTASAGNGIAFSSGKQMRFGRLRISNANGTQLLPLKVQMQAQYWASTGAGNSFITNTDDSCTALAAANFALGNYQKNLNACETSVTVGSFTGGRSTVQLSAPGNGNNGSVDLTANLGAGGGTTCIAGAATPVTGASPNRAYLQGNWSGGAYDQNPTARAAFGVYRGAEEVIHIRENY